MNAEEAPVAMSQSGRSVKHQVAKMNTGVMNIIIHTVPIQFRRWGGTHNINLISTMCHSIYNAV